MKRWGPADGWTVSTRREGRERSSREGGCKARGEEPEGVKTQEGIEVRQV